MFFQALLNFFQYGYNNSIVKCYDYFDYYNYSNCYHYYYFFFFGRTLVPNVDRQATEWARP